MFKAAFTGRSETGGSGSGAGRSSKDKDESRRKKSSHSHRAESVISTTSRRDDDRDRERRRSHRSSSLYENGSSYSTPGNSTYATAPSSRVGETRPLTESALRMLPNDDDEWEDEDKDARSEKKSRRRGESGDEKRRRSTRSEKDRSRSRSKERREKRKETSRTLSSDEKKSKDRSKRQPELVAESSRAIPEMGSFAQFPGQYGGGMIGQQPPIQDTMMSGALPSSVPQQQFPGQEYATPYTAPHMPARPTRPTREDSFGAAAEYYLDEGQSVGFQPGNRPYTPNMLVNPDLHLHAATASPHPVEDTGNGAAADFYSGKVSPIVSASAPVTPAKPPKSSKIFSSSASKPSKTSKPHRTPSTGVAAAALTAAGIGALTSSSKKDRTSSSQQKGTTSSSSSYQQTSSAFTSRQPGRTNSSGDVYYAPPQSSSASTYPPTLPPTNGYGPSQQNASGNIGKQSTNTNSNIPLYAAGAAAAGFAAYEYNQHGQNHSSQHNNSYKMASAGGYGGGGNGPPRTPRADTGGNGYYPPNGSGSGMGMQHQPFHEHKGPITRLKDGLLDLISSPEDTAKMEMYTEYIGVCKHCFDPRTSAWDAPRVHHYHKRSDSFENLRRRRSYEKMSRKGSSESLRRQNSRVDKDNRYYASESSRRKRESGGTGILGTGLAAAGVAAGANALFNDRKNFDDTYSVKSGHRESSAVRRRSRSSSREQRRRSSHGVVGPNKEEYVTVRLKDGTIERRKVSRKARSSSRDRKSSYLGTAAAGAALGAAGLAANSRYHSKSRSRSRSPSVLNGKFDSSFRRHRSPGRSSHHRESRPQESDGFFGSFFSPPKNKKKRRGSHERQKKQRGFFTFSNGSSSSSNSEMAFGDAFSSKTNLPLRRKSSTVSNRSGRRHARKSSDDHLAATVAGIGATAAALAAAQKGHRISKRSSRPELGRRREVRYSTDHPATSDEEWEDELPSDVDDESSVDGGLAFGDYKGKRLSSRQSLESVGSQSSAGGLGAWGWRWGGKDQKRKSRKTPSQQRQYPPSVGSFDASKPINKPVYLDDTGRPLPSMDSTSTPSLSQGPMQFVDPQPLSDATSMYGSRHASMPGAFDYEPPVIRPGPGPIQHPQPISPAQHAFTQSPPKSDNPYSTPSNRARRANSSPTRGSLVHDAALIGAAALATGGIIAGANSKKAKDPSNVRFGLTEEQQRREDRDLRKDDKKNADEERRRADRARAVKEEAERAAREARQEEVRRAHEEENRRRAEAELERQRAAQREAEERARREREIEQARLEQARLEQMRAARDAEERAQREREKEKARIERERLEREARDRQEAAVAATAEAERSRKAREEAQKQMELRERERREREQADAREQARLAEESHRQEDARRQREMEERERYQREQESERYERERQEIDKKHSSGWGSVAAGAAAAATVGAVMAGREHEKSRGRKSREDSYYDDAHFDRKSRRSDSDREADEQAEMKKRAQAQYGRNQSDVEVRNGYTAAEITPQNAHEGEPLMDDDIFDPDFFKRKRGPQQDPRVAEFVRKAADKVVSERRAPSPSPDRDNYADFFAPKDLLSKAGDDKTRSTSPHADNEIQVYHARDAEIQSHFHGSNYGYGRGKDAPYGVPRLNVIAPTPPPGAERSSAQSKKGKSALSKSPLNQEEDAVAEEPMRSTVSGKSERSRSISWGADKTHIYDVETPDSFHDRDSYVTSPDIRAQQFAAGAAGVAGAAAAGKAFHEIIVEDPSGEEHRYSEEDWARQEKDFNQRRGKKSKGSKDDDEVEEVTPEPEAHHGFNFYRQPFADSVSDMGTGIFNLDSPGTEGAPPVRGYVEGETEEPTPAEERAPRIPGGFDDDMDDIYRPRREKSDPVSDEIAKEQAGSAGASREPEVVEEPAWEPQLSKKEKKKREKAAKRASIAESDPPTPVTKSAPTTAGATEPQAEPSDYFPISKKDKKKAKKQGLADLASSMMSEPTREREITADEPPTVAESEPPLSKKEQKKRDKGAKKQGMGFADVTDTILAAGGIAAAAAALDSTEDSGSGSGKKKKKGKKFKLGEPSYDDPRDMKPNTEPSVESTMPGGWDDEPAPQIKEIEPEERSAFTDPWQTKGQEAAPPAAPEPPPTQEVDDWAEWAAPKKSKKKSKRNSGAFNLPDVSSPLRSEVPMEDYMGEVKSSGDRRTQEEEPYTNGHGKDRESPPAEKPSIARKDSAESKSSGERVRRDQKQDDKDERKGSDNSRQVSPDDARSVVSAPNPDLESRRKSRRDEARKDNDEYDEPGYAWETQSVAASEPADVYESSRKSKRRSHHADDDDNVSVISSRSRRERDKEESPSSKKDKEKKGGLFGLFSRRSVDDARSSKDSKYDGASLSRESTRDSKGGDEDDESRRRRKKKHRSSDYGDDDDDTRSVMSESRHRRSRSEYGDDDDDDRRTKSESRHRHRHSEADADESRERRGHRTRDDEYDCASPARSEPGRSHRQRRDNDEDGESLSRRDSRESRGAVSETGRHHHRRRTDEDAYSSRDQSFLGMRVEDLPPLPVSRPASPDLAAEKQEQGEGSPADAESGPGLVKQDRDDVTPDRMRHMPIDGQLADQDAGLPLETPPRLGSMHRHLSSTAVPLRFPFGHAPQTPGSLKERAHSFSSPISQSSPASPISGRQTRQGRPHSNEIRPLYLVESTRKTPEVEDHLPSLPSSKPSSRASSVQESDDNYQSAVEEFEADLPSRHRSLTIDTAGASTYPREDYLDSEETTPKASQFQHALGAKPPKQAPQFYTWEDFARDEQMHDEEQSRASLAPDVSPEEPVTATRESAKTTLPDVHRRRSKSPSFKSVAAAAMLGTAAVYGYHKLTDRSPEREPERQVSPERQSTAPAFAYPLPASVEDTASSDEPVKDRDVNEAPALSRKSSSKKKTGKKGRKSSVVEDEPEAPVQSSEADNFIAAKTAAEEGTASRDWSVSTERAPVTPGETYVDLPAKENALDRFLHQEHDMEEGAVFPSAATHTMPVHTSADQNRSREVVSDIVAPESAPTLADESGEHFLEAEEQLEAGIGKPDLKANGSSDMPTHARDESSEFEAPKLTRKQSKKSKKKQKAAALFDGEFKDEASEPPSNEQEPEVTAEKSEPAASEVTATPAIVQAPQINFGMHDFSSVAHGTQSSWHDTQARSFQDSMLQSPNYRPVDSDAKLEEQERPVDLLKDLEQSGETESVETGEFTVSKKKGKKDKKKKPPTWSEPEAELGGRDAQDVDVQHETAQDVSNDNHDDLIAAGATAGALAIAGAALAESSKESSDFETPKSKKKAKKDKKKKPPTWSEPEGEESSPKPDDLDVETTNDAEPSHAFQEETTSEPFTEANTSPAEPVHDIAVDTTGAQKEPLDQTPNVPRELDQQAETQPDESTFAPILKKRGKKSKRKSVTWSEPDIDACTPTFDDTRDLGVEDSKPAETDQPSQFSAEPIFAEPEAIDESQGTAQTIFAEPATIEESQPAAQAEYPEELFAPVSRKQSKKDKKKKKAQLWEPEPEVAENPAVEDESEPRQGSVDSNAFANAIEYQTEETPERDILPEVSVSAHDESAEPAKHDQSAEDVQREVSAPQAEEEDFAPVSTKKSKKDRKKKKQQSFDFAASDLEPEIKATETPAVEESAERTFEDAQESQQPSQDDYQLDRDDEPLTDENAPPEITEERSLSDELAQQPKIIEVDPTPDTFTPAVSKKKGKKDKKKRQTLDWSEPDNEATDTALPESRDALTATDEASALEEIAHAGSEAREVDSLAPVTGVGSSTSEAAVEPETSEAPSLSHKQSKKDKKKKRQTLDWTGPSAEATDTALPESRDELAAGEDVIALEENKHLEPEIREVESSIPAVNGPTAPETVSEPADSEAPSLSRKQSKKDKKKKKQQSFQFLPDDEPTSTEATSTEPVPESAVEPEQSTATLEDINAQPSDVPLPEPDDEVLVDPSHDSPKDHELHQADTPEADSSFVDARAFHEPESSTAEHSAAEPVAESWEDALSGEPEFPPKVTDTKEVETSVPTTEAEDDDMAWATSSKKKGKKGEKARQSLQEPSTPQELPPAAPIDETAEQAPIESVSKGIEAPAQDLADREASAPAGETPEEFAWATSSKKKGKKGKKSGTQTPVTLEPSEPEVKDKETPVEPPADYQDVPPPVEETPEEFAWAPSSKKKKGKKGKSGSQTPVTLVTEPELKDVTTPEASFADKEDTPALVEDTPEEFAWATGSKKKKKGKKSGSQNPVTQESSDPAFDGKILSAEPTFEEPAEVVPSGTRDETDQSLPVPEAIQNDHDVAFETSLQEESSSLNQLEDATPATEQTTPAATEDDADLWISKSSKKKKGKKGKQSSSGFATSIEETPASATSAEITHKPESTRDTEVANYDPYHEHAATDIEHSPQDEIDSAAEPQDATLNDIWADEDIVTEEDHEAVRDLMDGSSERNETIWSPSTSKKGKKGKKAKKGSVTQVATPLGPVVEATETKSQAASQLDDSTNIAPIEKADDKTAIPVESPISQDAERAANEPIATPAKDIAEPVQSDLQPAKAIPHEESATSTFDRDAKDELVAESMPTATEPQPSEWDSFTIKSGKKGKKNKKNKQFVLDDPEALDQDTQPSAAPDVSEGAEPSSAFVSAESQAPTEAESSDDWAVPTKSKKGEKSKKFQQTSTWDDEASQEPVQPDPIVDIADYPDRSQDRPSETIEAPDTIVHEDTAESQQPTEAESSDTWAIPSKAKKGKKGKKSKQASAWDDEPSEEPAQTNPIEEIADLEKTIDRATETMDGPKPQVLDQHSQPQYVLDTPANADPSATIISPDSQEPIESEPIDAWALPSKSKKGKKGKKSKASAWADEPSEESQQLVSTTESENSRDLPTETVEALETVAHEETLPPLPSSLTIEAEPEAWTIQHQELARDEKDRKDDFILTRDVSVPEKDLAEDEGTKTTPEQTVATSTEPEPLQANDDDFAFTMKKSKKDKKKGKKSRSSTADPWADAAEETPASIITAEPGTNDDSKQTNTTLAVAAAAVAVAGAAALASVNTEPQEDEWADFSTKKSKKSKKKSRRSGTSTPAMQEESPMIHEEPTDRSMAIADGPDAKPAVDNESARLKAESTTWVDPVADTLDAANLDQHLAEEAVTRAADAVADPSRHEHHAANEHSWDEELNCDVTLDEAARTGLPEVSRDELLSPPKEPDTIGTQHGSRALGDAHATGSTHPSHDIDFTATVAAGLADSGFNPDMVINDPVFQRRASPPGTIAEADPDEIFATTTTKRKKGKKSKRSMDGPGIPAEGSANPVETPAPDSSATGDFDDTINQSLKGTGFDPALLENALASSDTASREVHEESDEFAFTTTKRKKGKKGKKSQTIAEPDLLESDAIIAPKEDAPELPRQATESREQFGQTVDFKADQAWEETAAREIPFDFKELATLAPQVDAQPSNAAKGNQTDDGMQTDTSVNILTVGRDEMDMDEMDRQYKAYKKNKRKQKKLNAITKAAEQSDNPESAMDDTERSNAVSENEARSRNTTLSDAISQKPTIEEANERQVQRASEDTPGKAAARGIVANAFPGLERVKRRAPSPKDTNQQSRGKSPAGVLLTSEQSQNLPMEVPRSPPPPHHHRDTHSSKDQGNAGLITAGIAAAGLGAAAPAAQQKKPHGHKDEPSWSFAALDDQEKPHSVNDHEDDRQVIRDSGYQEGKRSSRPLSHESNNREIPEILHTSSSRDSLRQRRSLEPLSIPTPERQLWDIQNPKKRQEEGRGRALETHSRTPSAGTPLKPTSKDRASYLFQSPPDILAGFVEGASPALDPHTPSKSPETAHHSHAPSTPRETTHLSHAPSTSREASHHSHTSSASREASHHSHAPSTPRESIEYPSHDSARDRSIASPSNALTSPRAALHAIPEEHHAVKRRKADSDVGGPEHIKALQRTETPQRIRARQHTTSPSDRPHINIPSHSTSRSVSNPLSTDELINRLSWPSVDEQNDTINIDRHLGHRHSKPMLPDPRSPSVMSNRSNTSGNHFRSPQELRSYSRTSNRSSTPSLRRISLSSDLRAASRRGDSGSAVGVAASPITIPFEPPPTPPLNEDEVIHGSASRAIDMSDDVFSGYGDAQRSQVSPTRPPSVRKRQSMHITELESRIEQLAAENRSLQEARQFSGQNDTHLNGQSLQEALATRDLQLREKDAEINQIKTLLQPLQEEVARLVEINGGLTEANRNLVDDTNGRYATLQAEHAEAHENWRSTSRDLETMRSEHGRITSGMKDIIEAEIASALADKNAEILRLREQLDIAAEQIRALQVQIQSSKTSDFLIQRDEDYFDGSCQKLCQHVQQWVLRFSKLSDNRVCRLSTDLKDDKLEARLDNAILDGSDVDKLLVDRIKRRDVFMSVVMTMVWEYIFTRYLFGMDREQRQKLKALEKELAEVGPPRAVAHWRATVLTLLSKRPSFDQQRTLDTEAVAHEIFGLLCALLPPPPNAEQQLLASLQKVIGIAVNLSIEMRTQRAEYIMLPPLQPEYDTNGDLVRKVHFNASLMNERSGFFSSNEELAAEQAVVKLVLFPLVVKKGDDVGEGEEEIVVCPAQVLVQNDGGRGKKVVRVMSGAMEIDDPIRSRQSRHSLVSEAPGSVF